jgi:hypothetical protein
MEILQEIKAGRTPARDETHDSADGSNDAFGGSVPCDEPAGPEALGGEYISSKELASRLSVSLKFVQKHVRQIPGMVKITRKCVRFHLPTIEKRLLSGNSLLIPK